MSTTLALAAAGLLVLGGSAARADDLRIPASVTAAADANMRGLITLRDRTLLAAHPGSATPIAVPTSEEPGTPASGMPDIVRGALGCTIGGTVATVAAFVAGGENTINIVAGGLVPSVNRAALYVSLVGVVFGSFCAIGQALTPIFVRELAEPAPAPQPPPVNARHAAAGETIPQRMAFQAGVLAGAVASGAQRLSTTALAAVPPLSEPGAASPVRLARQP